MAQHQVEPPLIGRGERLGPVGRARRVPVQAVELGIVVVALDLAPDLIEDPRIEPFAGPVGGFGDGGGLGAAFGRGKTGAGQTHGHDGQTEQQLAHGSLHIPQTAKLGQAEPRLNPARRRLQSLAGCEGART